MTRLKTWKGSAHRKPLILQGARQVDKTHCVPQFGRNEYAIVVLDAISACSTKQLNSSKIKSYFIIVGKQSAYTIIKRVRGELLYILKER